VTLYVTGAQRLVKTVTIAHAKTTVQASPQTILMVKEKVNVAAALERSLKRKVVFVRVRMEASAEIA